MPSQNSHALRLALCATILLVGCSPKAEIRVYKVPKDSGGPALAMQGENRSSQETQILGAILPNRNAAWFFKLTGDPEVVDEHGEEFRRIVDSVQFDTVGEPTWELAEGWSQQLAQGMSYAKLSKDSAGLTATVTQLFNVEGDVPWNEDSWKTYVAENVNRWRGQLALDQQQWDKLEPDLEEVAELSQGPAKAYFVSLVGQGSGGMRGPFQAANPLATGVASTQSNAEEPQAQPPTDNVPAAKASPRVRGEAPQGWTALDVSNSSMRLLAFRVDTSDAEEPTEVTVIEAGGDIAANMNMWMNQVALESSPEKINEIVSQVEQLPVQGVTASVYFLAGTEEASPQAILVADVPWTDRTSLYVKLKGQADVVLAQRENFLSFVRSLTWGSSEGTDSAGEQAQESSSTSSETAAPPTESTDATPVVPAPAEPSPQPAEPETATKVPGASEAAESDSQAESDDPPTADTAPSKSREATSEGAEDGKRNSAEAGASASPAQVQ